MSNPPGRVCLMVDVFVFTETPLTFAAHLDNMVETMKVLKNGGAHLDFRAKDGMTALHKAARSKNQVTLTVSLDIKALPAQSYWSLHCQSFTN